MKKRFLYTIVTASTLCAVPLFLNNLAQQKHQDSKIDVNQGRTKKFSSVNYRSTIPQLPESYGVNIKRTKLSDVENNMYPWEVESLALYEGYSGTLLLRDTTFLQAMYEYKSGTDYASWVIKRCETNFDPKTNNLRIIPIISISNTEYRMPQINIKCKNVQEPTRLVPRNDVLLKSTTDSIVDSLSNSVAIKKTVKFNVQDSNLVGAELSVFDLHDDNEKVKDLYPSNIAAIASQPQTTFTVNSQNVATGKINFNVKFSTGQSSNVSNAFLIAYFDDEGKAVRFFDKGSKINEYNIVLGLEGFVPKTNVFNIFNGRDGEFLLYLLIAFSALVAITILYTIIHIATRNKTKKNIIKISSGPKSGVSRGNLEYTSVNNDPIDAHVIITNDRRN